MALKAAQVRFFDAKEGPSKPSLYLKIDGEDKPYALMQYSATFAKNEIPTATCVLGTGTSVSNNNATATPEELAETINGSVLKKAKIFLRFGPHSYWVPGKDTEWEPKQKCIFEGYVAGLSYTRVGSQIQFTVNLVHRLVDLTFGSLMSGWQHSSNPINLLAPAIAQEMGGPSEDCKIGGGAGAPTGTWTIGSYLDNTIIDGGTDDFGKALLDTMKCLAGTDVFTLDCKDFALPEKPNLEAAEVLKSMVSKTGGLKDFLHEFVWTISDYMGKLLDDSRGLTYWDFLVNKLCPDFVMAVIPLPSIESSPDDAYAYLIADTPGLKTPYKTLYLGDYTNFNLKARLWKPLYAVGIMSYSDNIAGAQIGNNKQKPIKGALCVGGVYPDPSSLEDQVGQFLIMGGPLWLRGTSLISGAMKDWGNDGNAANDAIAGGDEQLPPPPGNSGKVEPANKMVARSEVLDKYAELVYVHNAINGRGGTFDSKLRFDIAPGTILRLHKGLSGGDGAAARYQELPGNVIVQVSRVSHNINAESPMAKTTFECVHLRTEAENEGGLPAGHYSVDDHVFLEGDNGAFKGAPLIEDWKFDDPAPDIGDVLGDLDPDAVAGIA